MITSARLRELLSYNPQTGVFTWRVNRGGTAMAGAMAGNHMVGDGRLQIYVDGKNYTGARLAWFYAHDQWPTGDVDHINGDPSDDRLANLRDVPRRVNQENRRRARSDSYIGLLGVSPNRNRWRATIRSKGQWTHLGTFDTPAEAHAAYVAAKRVIHEGCTI